MIETSSDVLMLIPQLVGVTPDSVMCFESSMLMSPLIMREVRVTF